jgi:DNA ligase (NAD+)
MIAELNQRLVEAREAYYAGHPVMSDSQFDILEAQLAGMIKNAVELTDQATVLTTVGPGGRVPHRFPMRSIENRYTEEALTEFLYVDETLTLSSKWDGISVSIEFDDHGSLRQALTRGDGDAGEDITAQVLAVEAIPKCIPQGPLNIRGELVIAQSTLESLNLTLQAKGLKPYSSTRNLVAGTMKLKDVTLIPGRKVQFRPWEVLGARLVIRRSNDCGRLPLGVLRHRMMW